MIKNKRIKYNPIYSKVSSIISLLAVTTSLLTFMTFGSYKETLASSDTARVAKYVLELSEEEDTITEFIPGTEREIEFEIKNFKGSLENVTSQNEIKLQYKIKLEIPERPNLPIEYELYRVINGTEEQVNLVNGESDNIEVSMTSEVHAYKLKLIWPDGFDEIDYQNLTDNIKVIVKSEQID